jgi:hypothetical protein
MLIIYRYHSNMFRAATKLSFSFSLLPFNTHHYMTLSDLWVLRVRICMMNSADVRTSILILLNIKG